MAHHSRYRTSSQPRLSEGRGSLVLHGGIFHIISLYINQCPSRQSDKRLEPNPAGLLKQRITRTSAAEGTITSPSGQPKPLETLLKKTHEAWDQKLNSTAYPFAFNTQSRESHEPQQPRERSQASRIFARFTAPFAKPPLDSISITSQQLYRLHHLRFTLHEIPSSSSPPCKAHAVATPWPPPFSCCAVRAYSSHGMIKIQKSSSPRPHARPFSLHYMTLISQPRSISLRNSARKSTPPISPSSFFFLVGGGTGWQRLPVGFTSTK